MPPRAQPKLSKKTDTMSSSQPSNDSDITLSKVKLSKTAPKDLLNAPSHVLDVALVDTVTPDPVFAETVSVEDGPSKIPSTNVATESTASHEPDVVLSDTATADPVLADTLSAEAGSSKIPSTAVATESTVPTSNVPDLGIRWERRKGSYYPFPAKGSGDADLDPIEFHVTGTVVTPFLSASPYPHTVIVDISIAEIDKIKAIALSAPRQNDSDYRWPFDGTEAKFSNKDDLSIDFPEVWDGRRDVDPLDVVNRPPLAAHHIEETDTVLIEYSLVLYGRRRDRPEVPGFGMGCRLVLLAVVLVDKGRKGFNFDSPRKRRRMEMDGTR